VQARLRLRIVRIIVRSTTRYPTPTRTPPPPPILTPAPTSLRR
jgi:hypothetical protein